MLHFISLYVHLSVDGCSLAYYRYSYCIMSYQCLHINASQCHDNDIIDYISDHGEDPVYIQGCKGTISQVGPVEPCLEMPVEEGDYSSSHLPKAQDIPIFSHVLCKLVAH